MKLFPTNQRAYGDRLVARLGHPVAACMLITLFAIALTEAVAAPDPAASIQPGPMLTREGERLIVPARSPLRSHLVVAAATQSGDAHAQSFPAVVEADSAATVNIAAPVAGRIVAMPVHLGDVVHTGEVLLVMASSDFAQASADLEKARDALGVAERALERAQGVNAAGGNANKDLEQVQSNRTQAQSELHRAQARMRALGMNDDALASTGQITIRAPIAGVVTALNVGAGAFANDPTATLMTIANLSSVWVTANIPEADAQQVRRGLAADVTLPSLPGQILHGKVAFVSAVLDPDTRRMKARIVFSNPEGALKPNMFATVRLALPQTLETTVPPSALIMNNDSTTVFVEVAPWTFVRRIVEVGRDDGEMVRIVSGLKPGEHIVVRGGVLLND